ncbi:Insect cuticle protein [Trinorchestia longiramus]|nr:Insect cuticle protein [Trinorchestia longiramus]
MFKFTSRFCLWPLLAALVLLSPVSSQSNSRTPSQLYDTPQQPPAAVLPTRLPTPHDDREGSIVFPNISLQPTDGLPTPPAPRPPAPTPAGPPSAMMGMPYDFDWDVQDLDSGNIYSHAESSDGTVTRGEYRVLLPDGRLQIVQFVDRGNGYEAKVSYEVYNGQVPQNF